MSVAAPPSFDFEHTFVRDLSGLYESWQPSAVPAPELLVLNDELAAELGFDAESLRTEAGLAMLAGNVVPDGAVPVAQAYAGHQFGGYSPRLGDGRALLLGELIDRNGKRRDVHLKGSGRTPFARGGDGKAAVGPMLREHLIGEAMHALGIPTTRALAVVATGEKVARDTWLPGAILVRVAASHLRIGTFQYAASTGDPELLVRLADHAVARHQPEAADAEQPYLALLRGVIERQAALVAAWMNVGFIHGVMNTDNMTISGETIDYGPCAFMDVFDPATVFSSIDHGGRYAYGNQPSIAMWNLARLAETLLPLLADDTDAAVEIATETLRRFPDRFHHHWSAGMRVKLGLRIEQEGDTELFNDLLSLMHAQHADFTSTFRALSAAVRDDAEPLGSQFAEPASLGPWLGRWQDRRRNEVGEPEEVAAVMDRVNPIYVPRNHLVEEALASATAGDLAPFERLASAVGEPFDERAGFERYAQPAGDDFGPYQTFCGT